MQTDFARQPQWRKRSLRGLTYKIYQKSGFVKLKFNKKSPEGIIQPDAVRLLQQKQAVLRGLNYNIQKLSHFIKQNLKKYAHN